MAARWRIARDAQLPHLERTRSQHSHGDTSLTSGKKIQNEPIFLMHCKFQERITLGSFYRAVVKL